MSGERRSISEMFHAQLVQEAQLFRSRWFWITMLISAALAVLAALTVPVGMHTDGRPIHRGIDPVGINPPPKLPPLVVPPSGPRP